MGASASTGAFSGTFGTLDRSRFADPVRHVPIGSKEISVATQTKRKTTSRRGKGNSRLGAIGRGIGGNGRWFVRVLRWLVFLAVAGLVAGALLFFVLYRAIAIPDPNADFQTQTTNVMYSDGKTEIGSFATQDRENIDLSQMPASMQAAAIAAEDRSFATNNGIDFKGIIRALRDNTTSGEIRGGGSTITQQYVKILYLTQERSYTRKIKEAVLSVKIHNQLSKDQILEGYLNTIYFGNGAYGVEIASQTYFGKPAAEMNYAESAMLATIVNSPSYYDPYAEGWEDRLAPRFNYVLDGMEDAGAITSAEREEYRDRVPEVVKKKNSDRFAGPNGHILDMVQKEMTALEFSDAQTRGGGLRIVTSISKGRQDAAVDAVKEVRPEGLDELHTALVSIEPGTGAVRSLYGGPDYLKSQLNWATLPTQPGSTFKAFAVVAALENGYSLESRLNGSSPLQVDGGQIENQGDSGGESFGPVSLARATAKSINTAFVDLTQQMEDGPDKVLDSAQEAGIPASVLDPVRESGAPLVTPLGYFPVAPIDMANAYATLSAGGERADWYLVEQVDDADGAELYAHEVTTKRTISKDVAGDTIKAMQGVTAAGGTGTNGATVCPTAGKTGTATAGPDDDQRVSSSWFAGYTPKLATAVMYNRGVGNEDLEGYLQPFFGGTYPASTFRTFMNAALDPSDCGSFPPPGNIRADQGTVVAPPVPRCGPGQQLNGNRTGCVPVPPPAPAPEPEPTQDKCAASEEPDGNGGCKPKPVPTTPTEEPAPVPPTTTPTVPAPDEPKNPKKPESQDLSLPGRGDR